MYVFRVYYYCIVRLELIHNPWPRPLGAMQKKTKRKPFPVLRQKPLSWAKVRRLNAGGRRGGDWLTGENRDMFPSEQGFGKGLEGERKKRTCVTRVAAWSCFLFFEARDRVVRPPSPRQQDGPKVVKAIYSKLGDGGSFRMSCPSWHEECKMA